MDDSASGPPRERVRTYAEAGFPDYTAPDADGYPTRPDVGRRLAVFFSDTPDEYESRAPSLKGPREPSAATDPLTGLYGGWEAV